MKLVCCSSTFLAVILLLKTDFILTSITGDENTEFTKIFANKYDPSERDFRNKIFQQNLKQLQIMNNNSKNGVVYEINQFSVMTDDELTEMFSNSGSFVQDLKNQPLVSHPKIKAVSKSSIPVSFDWREKNAVTPAKDQQSPKCGSCYAFAVVAAIETVVAAKTGKLLNLSEQELVDCDLANYNITFPNNMTLGGCIGGSATNGIKYATKFGLFSEAVYPYTATNGTCRDSSIASGNKTFVKGITGPNPFTEDGFTQFIAQHGPLIIGFTIPRTMLSYSSGIMSLTPEECAKESVGNGHVMTLIGYGIEDGMPFFTAKNSFGPKWGENGFMRFQRGINFCIFSIYAKSPIF